MLAQVALYAAAGFTTFDDLLAVTMGALNCDACHGPLLDEPWESRGDYVRKGSSVSNQTHRSKVEPDSRLARKSNFAKPYLSYGPSYIMDNKSRVVVGADCHLPNRYADQQAALTLIRRIKWIYQ
jgi:hypothetical protein